MSDKTGIQWTDATWSPVTGCTRVSDGCTNCYIERTPPFRMAHRHFDQEGIGGTTGVQLHPERLAIPFKWRKPRRIFVCSMADLFHDDVPDGFIGDVFNTMALAERHTFQILTKRPARMRSLLRKWEREAAESEPMRDAGQKACWRRTDMMWCSTPVWPLPNVWLGASTENQQWADIRIPVLLDTPAAVRFVSAEPLLGPIDLDRPAPHHCNHHPGDICPPWYSNQLDWVIVGGESGRGARPMHPDWARSLRDQCADAGVAFHFKQWGEWTPGRIVPHRAMSGGAFFAGEKVGGHFAASLSSVHDFGDGNGAYRIGKKDAGRDLDGRTWDEYPAVSS